MLAITFGCFGLSVTAASSAACTSPELAEQYAHSLTMHTRSNNAHNKLNPRHAPKALQLQQLLTTATGSATAPTQNTCFWYADMRHRHNSSHACVLLCIS